SVEVGDVERLAFPDGAFDVVVALGVLTWLERAEAAMRELARVSRPGGYVIFTTPNAAGLGRLLDPARNPGLAPVKRALKRALEHLGLRRPRSGAPAPSMRPRSRRALLGAMRNADLVMVKAKTHGFVLTVASRIALPE